MRFSGVLPAASGALRIVPGVLPEFLKVFMESRSFTQNLRSSWTFTRIYRSFARKSRIVSGRVSKALPKAKQSVVF